VLAKLENLVPGVSSPAPTCAGGQWTRSAPQVGMRAGRHSRRSGSGGLTSVYGKSPAGRQGVRLDGCIARAHRCGAPVDSSANLDRPRRQRPGSHAVGSPPHTLVLCGRCGRSSSDKSTITQGARSVDSRQAASAQASMRSGNGWSPTHFVRNVRPAIQARALPAAERTQRRVAPQQRRADGP
jgi:hypothetical protein